MAKIKRFLVFKQWKSADRGGWDDLFGDFDSLSALQEAVLKERDRGSSWDAQVIDLETGSELQDPNENRSLLEGGELMATLFRPEWVTPRQCRWREFLSYLVKVSAVIVGCFLYDLMRGIL